MSDLIAQLRLMQRDGWSSPGKAADTIESQAKRIAELESELHYATSAGVIECMVRNKAVAERIAELEQALAESAVSDFSARERIAELEAENAKLLAASMTARHRLAACAAIFGANNFTDRGNDAAACRYAIAAIDSAMKANK